MCTTHSPGQATPAHPRYKTSEGKLEHRNPFLILLVPPTLLRCHPDWAAALAQNQDRRVTAFDIYATFQVNGAVGPGHGRRLSVVHEDSHRGSSAGPWATCRQPSVGLPSLLSPPSNSPAGCRQSAVY